MQSRTSARAIARVVLLVLTTAVCGAATYAVGQAATPIERSQATSSSSRLVPSVKDLGPGDSELAQAFVPKRSRCFLVAHHRKSQHHASKNVRSPKVRVGTGVAQFSWRTKASAWNGRWHLSVRCRKVNHSTFRTVAASHVHVGVAGKVASGGLGRAGIARRIKVTVVHGSVSGPGIGAGGGCDALGTVELPAASWLQGLGGGVPVYSNGIACSYFDPVTHPYQCVDLVNRLLVAKGWDSGIRGNATNFWENASTADFDRHVHDSGYTPVPGDIVVWGGSGAEGQYGHVQVVNSVSGSTIQVVQQNTSRGTTMPITMTSSGGIASRSWSDSSGYNTQYFKGFLHAKKNTGPSSATIYNGHIVQWDGDSNTQKTAWWVSGGLRYWIPTSAIYYCLKGLGAPGPDVLTATVLDSLPDQTGQWVSCDSSGVGIGSGPPPTDPSGPTAPPTTPPATVTYAETAGSVAHTWTNHTNAGGTEGPSIAAYQTVQIACKLTGFKVADGNTWWYRIAQSPWNSAYYVSADAFYNNGATSGPLTGTPFVDTNVPSC
jgi:hypothetical protein